MRWSTVRQAESLNLVGWVCNLGTGEVEGIAQGDSHDVAHFIDWLNEGPASARVHHVSILERPWDPQLYRFDIR